MPARIATVNDAATIAALWNQYKRTRTEFTHEADWTAERIGMLLARSDHLATIDTGCFTLWSLDPPVCRAHAIVSTATTAQAYGRLAACIKLALGEARARGCTQAVGSYRFRSDTSFDRVVRYFVDIWGTTVTVIPQDDGTTYVQCAAPIDDALLRRGF